MVGWNHRGELPTKTNTQKTYKQAVGNKDKSFLEAIWNMVTLFLESTHTYICPLFLTQQKPFPGMQYTKDGQESREGRKLKPLEALLLFYQKLGVNLVEYREKEK